MNSNYAGLIVQSAEVLLRTNFRHVYQNSHPVLAAITGDKDGRNFNKGQVQATSGGPVRGLKMLLPVVTQPMQSAGSAVGVSAQIFTPGSESFEGFDDALDPTPRVGLTMAAYEYSCYRAAFAITEEDFKLAENAGSSQRTALIKPLVDQMKYDFRDQIASDLQTSTVESRSKVIGIPYVTATSNSPGGISQSTYTNWASNVQTGIGNFTYAPIDKFITRISIRKTGLRNAGLNLIAASANPSGDVYDTWYEAVAASQISMATSDKMLNYGYTNFTYRGIPVVPDPDLAAGSAHGFSLDSWWFNGDLVPVWANQRAGGDMLNRVDKTLKFEAQAVVWCAVGCDDPGANCRWTGFTVQ